MKIRQIILMWLCCVAGMHFAVAAGEVYTVDCRGGGDFRTVQACFDALPSKPDGWRTVRILPGTYREKVTLDVYKDRVRIVGVGGAEKVRIVWNDHTGKVVDGHEMTTYDTWTMSLQADDVVLEGVTVENDAGRVGQAVALETRGDRIRIDRCRLVGDQDTFFTKGYVSRVYVTDTWIEGTTDFIFGPSIVLFDRCRIHAKADSFLTAASTTERNAYGYVFRDCRVTADPGVTKLYLGRPWKSTARTVWIRCELPAAIRPEGWRDWHDSARKGGVCYAEYRCTGPGADRSGRVTWSCELTDEEAARYTPELIFARKTGSEAFRDDWLPDARPASAAAGPARSAQDDPAQACSAQALSAQADPAQALSGQADPVHGAICDGCTSPAMAVGKPVGSADRGDGSYSNPVLDADYSDPDVIRTGDDFWMTSSSFNCVPGLQILHSTDLVNWQIVGAALPRLYDGAAFDRTRHGDGVWAPSIRFHDGWYYIFWGDPDRGVYMVRTQDPRGEWSEPWLVKAARGIIDPCPLWDDDGRAYLVHGWAGSRAGFKSVLSVCEMAPDGRNLIGEEVLIFDGHDDHPTVEGPKFYKRNDWYYVFAPAGGVKPGWQLVLRSRSPWGPYECRKVLHQGDTETPGPHQGAWVEDVAGDSWFIHFVDRYAYGRVVHLQPMAWDDDGWCRIGIDRNGDGVGEPVAAFRKPASRVPSAVTAPAASDDFTEHRLGLQWQWHANPQTGWYLLDPSHGRLRLMAQERDAAWRNLWDVPHLLLQKVPAAACTFTAKVALRSVCDGDRGGLLVMGTDYAALTVERCDGRLRLALVESLQADRGADERVVATAELPGAGTVVSGKSALSGDVWLRCCVVPAREPDGTPRMECRFSYSTDGRRFHALGRLFTARAGRWIGAKVGCFAQSGRRTNDAGWLDIDLFEVTEP